MQPFRDLAGGADDLGDAFNEIAGHCFRGPFPNSKDATDWNVWLARLYVVTWPVSPCVLTLCCVPLILLCLLWRVAIEEPLNFLAEIEKEVTSRFGWYAGMWRRAFKKR